MVRSTVVDEGDLKVLLRSYKRGGDPVARGFQHPAAIAPVRLAHILAFVDVEMGEGKKKKRVPAVPSPLLYGVADALGRALESAGPNEEVVVLAVRRDRHMGVFTRLFLTSFLAYVKDDLLTLKFGYVDWEVPKFDQGPGDELPEPKESEQLMDLRIVPDSAFTLLSPQLVAFDWRKDRFQNPERVLLSPTGGVRRRTILMESVEEEAPAEEPAAEALPAGLAPDTLRRLADLEEARRRGDVTEGEYQTRRRAILAADPAGR